MIEEAISKHCRTIIKKTDNEHLLKIEQEQTKKIESEEKTKQEQEKTKQIELQEKQNKKNWNIK